MMNLPLIHADWPAPARVHAVVTTRRGGVSVAPWNSFNLGNHVGDDAAAVAENRERLLRALQAIAPCAEPQWLNQVHGTALVEAEPDSQRRAGFLPDADAVTTTRAGLLCAVMTADCLPVFFCDDAASRVAVAHAGWRGLCAGVLESTLRVFPRPESVIAWLGPAIGPQCFEVGPEVKTAFESQQAEAAQYFRPGADSGNAGRWLADIYGLARLRLRNAGVTRVSGGNFCTVTEAERFFSYRRDGRTGRMASLIWLA